MKEVSEQLTLLSEASRDPASPSASPADVWQLTMPDGSGPSSHDAFASYDPGSRAWRTSQASLPLGEMETETGTGTPPRSRMSLVTWPSSGSMRTGVVYRRPPGVRRTAGGESSLWPTPTSAPTGDYNSREGVRFPSLQGMAKLWPTPKASDGEMGLPRTSGRSVDKVTHLATALKKAGKAKKSKKAPAKKQGY